MIDISRQQYVLQSAISRSGNYFLWVAGLSLVNTALILFTTSPIVSAVSLGVVDIGDAIISNRTAALGFSFVMSAIFAAIGWFARQGNLPTFITGMTLYALDALILVYISVISRQVDWISLAVHVYILYQLYQGVKYITALKTLNQRYAEEQQRQRIANAASGQP